MCISKESVLEFQKIFEKEYGKKISYEEAEETGNNLVGLMDILLKCEMKERGYKAKLKDSPDGYEFDNPTQYPCVVCGNHYEDKLWYDENGKKCYSCQKAINEKIVPAYICHHKDSYYSIWELDYYFKLKSQTAKKLARQDVLYMRVIENENNRPKEYLFLLEDNKGILPRKSLLKSLTVPVEGKERTYTSINWDEYQHPKDVIGEYGIYKHLTHYHDYTPKYVLRQSEDVE